MILCYHRKKMMCCLSISFGWLSLVFDLKIFQPHGYISHFKLDLDAVSGLRSFLVIFFFIHQDSFCGPFLISRGFWIDGGSCVLDNDNPNDPAGTK